MTLAKTACGWWNERHLADGNPVYKKYARAPAQSRTWRNHEARWIARAAALLAAQGHVAVELIGTRQPFNPL